MAESSGLTAEMYRAIVTVVDDRLKDIRVGREDFDRLSQTVAQLAAAQARTEQRLEQLAQAQARTEQRLEQLAQAQARTEQRLEQLAQAQARTEQRMDRVEAALTRLAEAQARTEQALQQLATQVGALAENIGYGLEDIARLVLPGYLQKRYGITVERLERRLFQADGQVVEVDLYGEGRRAKRRVVVLGEVKSRIYAREVQQFQRLLQTIAPQLPGEPVPLMFGYFIDLSALEAAGEEMLLVASYQPAVERARPPRRRKR